MECHHLSWQIKGLKMSFDSFFSAPLYQICHQVLLILDVDVLLDSNIFQIWFLILHPHLSTWLLLDKQLLSQIPFWKRTAGFFVVVLFLVQAPKCLEIYRIKLKLKALFKCHLRCELFSLLSQPEITPESFYYLCCLLWLHYSVSSWKVETPPSLPLQPLHRHIWCDIGAQSMISRWIHE